MERLIVGVTGASGIPLAVQLLQTLRQCGVETHLIVSRCAELTARQECDMTLEQLWALADRHYDNADIAAAPASGSWKSLGMVIVPCSMKTAAGVHSGYSDNLLLRAADVMLKERRKLVLVARETPLSTIHLRNLYELSQAGAVILPAVLTYYHSPRTIADMQTHLVGKILDQFGIDAPDYRRWGGMV